MILDATWQKIRFHAKALNRVAGLPGVSAQNQTSRIVHLFNVCLLIVKRAVKALAPPIILGLARRLVLVFRPPDWEYAPDAWLERNRGEQGWCHASVADIEVSKWTEFQRAISTTEPLGISHESPTVSNTDYGAHNTLMSFAYVLALAAGATKRLSLLDWGGGLGHYYLIAKAVIPDLDLDYVCADLPSICGSGRVLLPEATFYPNEDCFDRQYDLVFASSSLQYSEDWRGTMRKLAASARSYLFITRLPCVFSVPSFPVRQRPHRYGYETEYVGWFLNRDELTDQADICELELVREFLVNERPYVHGAPEQCEYRGFLFRPRHSAKTDV